jgi:hypothetical protein
MAIADRSGLPVAIGIASASPHEVTVVEETIDHGFHAAAPERLIGDRAYDSDGLDERLREERGIEPPAGPCPYLDIEPERSLNFPCPEEQGFVEADNITHESLKLRQLVFP